MCAEMASQISARLNERQSSMKQDALGIKARRFTNFKTAKSAQIIHLEDYFPRVILFKVSK